MRGFIDDFALLRFCKAYLDGEDVSARCVGVDEERGAVYLVAKDENGGALVMPEIGSTPARLIRYELRGRVELVVSPTAAPSQQQLAQRFLDRERVRQRQHGYQGAHQ